MTDNKALIDEARRRYAEQCTWHRGDVLLPALADALEAAERRADAAPAQWPTHCIACGGSVVIAPDSEAPGETQRVQTEREYVLRRKRRHVLATVLSMPGVLSAREIPRRKAPPEEDIHEHMASGCTTCREHPLTLCERGAEILGVLPARDDGSSKDVL